VRLAWSHSLFPVKTEATTAGSAFDLDHLSIASKDRAAIPAGVYEKAKNDGIAKERLGPDALWLHLKPLWPEDRPHLPINEIADWFASYVYLPKTRDRVVLEGAIRDALGKLDPAFGYADRFDEATATYRGLAWAKTPPELFSSSAVLVRSDVALEHSRPAEAPTAPGFPGTGLPTGDVISPGQKPSDNTGAPQVSKPRRFYGSVELDPTRPMKAFDTIINAVVMELQRNTSTKVKLTLEIEAEAPAGFDETDIGVVRDNARQLKFKPDSTGFD
jgi:hypothetical protein